MKLYLKILLYIVIITSFCSSTKVFAGSASLYITKPALSMDQGANITLDIRVSSPSQSINAVSGTVSFPEDLLRTVSIGKDRSILNIWTRDPIIGRNNITFEGVILNPGYQGSDGVLFHITFQAKKVGLATVSFREGSVLANDGLGTNILDSLSPTSFNILGVGALDLTNKPIAQATPKRLQLLPVITEYSQYITSNDTAYLKGKGEPDAVTKISFESVSNKSFGEQFLDFIQSKKQKLTDVFVKNNEKGQFEYVTPNNLIAGAYNATPFLVDAETNTNKPGTGVQLFVNDNKIVKWLIILINVLILLIPIVGLVMLIYFIPWYSARRMRLMRKRMGLEEEKIQITEHELERQDQAISTNPLPTTHTEKLEVKHTKK